MSDLNLRFRTDTPARDQITDSYFGTNTSQVSSEVRADVNLNITVEPIVLNPSGVGSLYLPDWIDTNTVQVAIGIADQSPTGGTFKLTAGATTTGLLTLAYNIPAATLQTPLSAAFVTEGKPACTVLLVATGVYSITGNSNGAIPTGFLIGDGDLLLPDGTALVIEDDLGSASTVYKLLLVIRASPFCYAEPSTALPTAGVTLTTTAAGSSTTNKIQKIGFDAPNTYGGTYKITASAGAKLPITEITIANPTQVTVVGNDFPNGSTVTIAGSNSTPSIDGAQVITVVDAAAGTFTIAVNVTGVGNIGTAQFTEDTTCGVAPRMASPTTLLSPVQLGQILNQHPQIFFQDVNGIPDNIAVTASGQDYFVEFKGTLGNSTAPSLALTNIDLIAPEGVTGTITLNTIALYEYSLTQTGETFDVLISVRVTTALGEIKTLFGPTTITIYKNLFDTGTMVPAPLPSYYTTTQSNARFAQLAANNTFTGTNAFGNGITVTSPAGGGSVAETIIADLGQSAHLVDWSDTITFRAYIDAAFNIVTTVGALQSGVFTVGTLPAGIEGMRASVTDATSTTFYDPAVGGMGNHVPVFHDGTIWRIG